MRLSEKHPGDALQETLSATPEENIQNRLRLELDKGTESGRSALLAELLFSVQKIDFVEVLELIIEQYQEEYDLVGLTLLCDDIRLLLAHVKECPEKFASVLDQVELFLLFLYDYVDVKYKSDLDVRKSARNVEKKISNSVIFATDLSGISNMVNLSWERMHASSGGVELDARSFENLNALERAGVIAGWRKLAEEVYRHVYGFLNHAIQVQLEDKNLRTGPGTVAHYVESVATQAMFTHQRAMLTNLERQHSWIVRALQSPRGDSHHQVTNSVVGAVDRLS